ncbi:MAG TPA: HD domain-containing protein [Syntrophomonadaceae bacterium]|nr:HD domain-containing protein [Syntrophomonadaceae bacterium]
MLASEQALELIESRLSRRRYEHSLQVALAAREMARDYGLDAEKAYLTGLLHDYAKGLSGAELLRIAEEQRLLQEEIERQVPDLLHATVGAYLLEAEGKVLDPEILYAIRVHTLGAEQMSDFDKIIFLADMIEPGRDYPGLQRLQCLARKDLDQAMLFALDSTIRYCLEQGRLLHPQTIKVRNNFLQALKE